MKSLHFNFRSSAICIALVAMLFIPFQASAQSVIRFEPSRASVNANAFGKYFSKYAIGSINTGEVSSLLQSKNYIDSLTLEADGVMYSFSLYARDVRSDNYVLRAQTESGIQVLPRSPNKTFSGLTWEGAHPVCITADEHFFTAMIMTNTGTVYIESAKLIDASVDDNQFVIYHESDVIKHFENSMCGTKIPPNYQAPKEDTTAGRALLNCIVSEVAIADDYSMFTKYGNSVANVEWQNLAVLNLVNTNYDNEFSQEVFHKAVEIFVVTTSGGNPWYTGTDPNLLLNSFTAWAPNGFVSNHDFGSLWSNRDFDGTTVGLAWVQVLCDSAYNVLQDFSPNFGFLRCTQAHEMGHGIGYGHDATDGYIMSPTVSESNVWSAASISTINTDLFVDGVCLAQCPPASNGRVGIGTTSPNPTAILDITSTNKGLLMPRMTTLQRSAIYKPADGLVVYDTGTKSFWFYNSSAWIEITDGSTLKTYPNSNATFGFTGNLGLGVDYPKNKLDIAIADRVNPTLDPTNLPLYITGDAPNYKGLEVRNIFADQGIGISANGIYATGWTTNNSMGLEAKGPTGYLNFSTNTLERMRITGPGNVGIGTNAPNASAALDITSNSKGILIPRMTTTERNAIASPVTGLLVFDITTNSFWFRGTSTWIELTNSLETEVFRNGTDKIYTGLTDSVGIGTINPDYKLHVQTLIDHYGIAHTGGTVKIATWVGAGGEIGTVSNHSFSLFANDGVDQFQLMPNGNIGIGLLNAQNRFDVAHGSTRTGTHATGLPMYVTGNLTDAGNGFEIRQADGAQGVGIGRNTIYAAGSTADQNLGFKAKGIAGNILFTTNTVERMRIDASGQVGLGIIPHAPLQLASISANRKIVLWETANNNHQFYGFGVNASVLRYQVDATTSDHVFYAAFSTGASNELFRIKGTGEVGIGLSTPHAQLQLATTVANRKLVLYEVANNDHQYHGFGIDNDGALRYQTANTLNDHVFYAGASATSSNELMRIRGSGNVAIAGVIETEADIAPTLGNGFTQYGNGYAPATYYKDKQGIVHLKGMLNTPANPTGLVIFTLPVGYRPTTSGTHVFMTMSNGNIARVDVLANGNVVYNSGPVGWVTLEPVTFRAD